MVVSLPTKNTLNGKINSWILRFAQNDGKSKFANLNYLCRRFVVFWSFCERDCTCCASSEAKTNNHRKARLVSKQIYEFLISLYSVGINISLAQICSP